uniref:Putative loner n=1 Tax=Anopheles marajoara TaxID=58244 RepID=A0A2M4BP83_9DIPT
MINRVRAYPASGKGPYTVFIMPREAPLDTLAITRALTAKYKSVTDVFRVKPNKLQVTVGDRMQANAIAADPTLTSRYRVYIPGSRVEVAGVVEDVGIPPEEILKYGLGAFQSTSSKAVKVLEARSLFSASIVDGKKTFQESSSLRVTFEGTILPCFLIIQGLRIPIKRPYFTKVASCAKCSRIGHSADYCTFQQQCGKCRGGHKTEECSSPTQKCPHCKKQWHDVSECPAYRQIVADHKKATWNRFNGSFAAALKSQVPATGNSFSLLEGEDEEAEHVESQPMCTMRVVSGRTGKGKKSRSVPKKPKKPRLANPRSSAPAESFPTLPAAQNVTAVPPPSVAPKPSPSSPRVRNRLPHPSPIQQLPTVEELLASLLASVNLPDPLKAMLSFAMPMLVACVKQWLGNWPALEMLVRLDENKN